MKFSMINKTIPIELETSQGEVKLQLTEYTIADMDYLHELYKPYIDDNGVLKQDTLVIKLTVARVMACLKDLKGNHYFGDKTVEDVIKLIGKQMIDLMIVEVNKLNPLPEVNEDGKPVETLESKKKLS